QAPAQPAGPAARARRPRGGPGPRPGHRVRLPARLRARGRRTQHRLAGHRRVLLVLDTSRTSAGRIDDVPRLDSAMDAALLLAALASRAGDSVDFLAGDRRVRARVRAGARGDALPQVVEAMADLEPTLVEADWSRLTSAVVSLGKQPALVVLLSA